MYGRCNSTTKQTQTTNKLHIMNNKYPRLLTALCALILTIGSLWAVPAYRGWQERTLADGTTITLRQIGDEFYHYWETQDGKIALEQEDGTFVVTDQPRPTGEQIAARRKASNMYQSQPRKAIGERNLAPKGLVILVQFKNISFNASNNATAFNNMLNQVGYSYGGATGSAVDYFTAQSNGTYVPAFDVFGPVTLPENRVYYGEQGTINGSEENDMYIADFVIDAVKAADEAGCDFSQYDSDGDGYVDIVYFFYAGKGQAAGGTSETIWPHNWELNSALYYGQTHGNSGYSYGNLPRLDGKRINNYVCSAELKSDGSRSGIGTLCHEFSHVLGMPDYYDTKYGDNYKNEVTPGEWSIMDQGSYNNNEMTPPNYSIFDKYFMGWATPKFLAKDEKKNVTMSAGYNDAYQITGGSTLAAYTSTSTVYYIENRQKSGWDAYLPGHGMIVWQVKYNSSAWSNNAPNNTSGNPRYTIVPADGKTKNYGDGADPFPGTKSKKSYTPVTGCAMTEITESSNNITFKYNGGVNKTKCTYEFLTDHCSAPADGEVAINAALNVTITPDDGYTLADVSCWTVEMGGVELTYGSGFTYNVSTGAFSIASLTDDVVIMAEAKQIFTVTWSVNGSTTTANYIDGASLVMPSTPSDCPGGKKFVGWTASTSVTGNKPADLFTAAGTKTVTANVTYYAVYATAGEGGGGSSTWTLVTDASSLRSGDVLVIASNTKGKTAGDISSQVMTEVTSTFSSGDSYATITSLGSGTVELTLGGSEGAWTLTSTSGLLGATTTKKLAWGSGTTTWSISITSDGATIQNGTAGNGAFLHNFGSTRFTTYTSSPTNQMLLPQLYRKGGGVSYSDYGTTCVICALSSISLNTDNVKKSFTTDDTFTSAGLVVTANYSNCSSRTVTPTNVSTPSLTTAGDKTVTVTYTENDVERTSTYTINVAAVVKHTVTWKTCGGTTFKTEQYVDGDPLVLPSSAPGANTEGKAFYGWTTESSYTGATAPATISAGGAVTADATYYAIYH